MAASISTVKSRDALKARRDPYFMKVGNGRFLGFRKISAAATGTWIARFRDDDGKQQTRSFGSFDTILPSERFDAARRAADEWFGHLGRGGKAELVTVRLACERYVAHVLAEGRKTASDGIAARFTRWVYSDEKLSALALQKLSAERVTAWRQALRRTPVRVGRSKENTETRDRTEGSVNRDATAFRAALNFAYDRGWVTSDLAWRVALRPTKNADGRRNAYLDRTQRSVLIAKSDADLAKFLKGLSLLPLRPGALAALTVASYEQKHSVLTIGKDKAGQARRIKLPASTAAFLAEQTKEKASSAPLLSRADGKAWDKDSWKKPVKAAALAAKLPDSITAYALRHSTITDLVTSGLDLLTVAQLSGTSVAMIERHYGHLQSERATAALATLTL